MLLTNERTNDEQHWVMNVVDVKHCSLAIHIWMCLCVCLKCVLLGKKEEVRLSLLLLLRSLIVVFFLNFSGELWMNVRSFVRPHIIFWVDFCLDLLLFLFTSEHNNALFSIALQCWKHISESESRYDKSSSIKCRRPQLVYILWRRRRLFRWFLFFFVGKILNIVFMLSVCFSRV